jgi:hypothetical protein
VADAAIKAAVLVMIVGSALTWPDVPVALFGVAAVAALVAALLRGLRGAA